MDDQKKPFDTASIVLLMLVSGVSDIADLVTDLIFPVPIIGQIIFLVNSFVISPIIWAIIQLSFIIKTGAGRASLVAAFGGLGNIANIPGSESITTAIAIAIANSPKVSEVANLVAKAKGRAVAGKAAGGKIEDISDKKFKGLGYGSEYFKENEEWLKKNASTYYEKEMGAARERGDVPDGGTSGKSGRSEGVGNKITPEALGEKPELMEDLQQKLLKETPGKGEKEKTQEEESVNIDNENNVVDLSEEREKRVRPERMHDKDINEAMRLRNERMRVAERLGMDKGQAAKKILDLEEEKEAA